MITMVGLVADMLDGGWSVWQDSTVMKVYDVRLLSFKNLDSDVLYAVMLTPVLTI